LHYFVIAVLFRLFPHDREAVLSALADTEYQIQIAVLFWEVVHSLVS